MTTFHVLLVVALAAPMLAHAQPSDPAKVHFEQGKALAASGRFAEAYLEFEAGYAADPRPAFLFNMGEAARGMGNPTAARAAYERYLAAEPTGPLADGARRRLAELPATSSPTRSGPDSKASPAATPSPAVSTSTSATSSTSSVLGSPAAAASPLQLALARPPEDGRRDRPLWKRWPFWAAVGGVIATGVMVGVVASSGGSGCGAGCIDLRGKP